MKFAKCIYSSFSNSVLELVLNKGDVFVVTPEIEESQVYQDSVNTKNFVPVEVNTLTELSKVVNLTPAIQRAFTKKVAEARAAREEAAKAAEPEPKMSTPVPEEKGLRPAPPEPAPKEEEKPPEEPPKEAEKPEEKPAEGGGDSEEDKTEEPKEEEKVLSFTELAGNVGDAIKAVEKETDIEKLNLALELDERVTVTKAIQARFEELAGSSK